MFETLLYGGLAVLNFSVVSSPTAVHNDSKKVNLCWATHNPLFKGFSSNLSFSVFSLAGVS